MPLREKRPLSEKNRLMLLRIVEKRIDEIAPTVRELEEAHETRELENPSASLLEASGPAYEAECARIISSHERRMLKALRAAHERISKKTYAGCCVHCGAAIGLERLKAVPESEYCMRHSPV